MSPDRASQFTLRDLIAAAVVLVLLATLVPSCVMEPRSPGRRNNCQSNMHNISLAALQFAEARGRYPGYTINLGSRTASYLVPLLPYMEKADVYNAWMQPDTTSHDQSFVYMSLLVCPSNPPLASNPLPNAYVINAGQADPADDILPGTIEAAGIATDQTVPDPVLVSPQYVAAHDGTRQTLLISENVQSQTWTLTDVVQLRSGTTFLWWNAPPKDTRDYRINIGKAALNTQQNPIYSRPSSNHPGGVVVSFCDGSIRFIAEDIDYNVYKQLMTPNGDASGDTVNRPLGESDY